MSCSDVFNFGGKLMCVWQGEPRQQRGTSTGVASCSPLCFSLWLYHWDDTAPQVPAGRPHLSSGHFHCTIFCKFSLDTWHYYTKNPILTKAQMAIFISVSGISKRSIKLTLHTALPVLRHKVFLLKIGEITRFTEGSWQIFFSRPD